jgi:hypothetical protein
LRGKNSTPLAKESIAHVIFTRIQKKSSTTQARGNQKPPPKKKERGFRRFSGLCCCFFPKNKIKNNHFRETSEIEGGCQGPIFWAIVFAIILRFFFP